MSRKKDKVIGACPLIISPHVTNVRLKEVCDMAALKAKKKIFLLTVCLFVLAGCASDPVRLSEARLVTEDRTFPHFNELNAKFKESGAKIIIVRDSGILGAGTKDKVLVNGKPIRLKWPKEKIEFYLPVGEHILGVVPEPKLGGALQEQAFYFRDPTTYYLRLSVSPTEGIMTGMRDALKKLI